MGTMAPMLLQTICSILLFAVPDTAFAARMQADELKVMDDDEGSLEPSLHAIARSLLNKRDNDVDDDNEQEDGALEKPGKDKDGKDKDGKSKEGKNNDGKAKEGKNKD